YSKPEDLNELFQKLLDDLKELVEYNNSPSRDRSTFLNDNENYSVQNKESLENASNEIGASNFNQEKEKPPQDSDIHQLIKEECCVEEVKNVVEQPVERGNLAPILSTEEPEHSLSMGYEHLSITHETESNEVTEFNAENLLPIPSECEVTSEDEIECDMPAKDDFSPVFTTFSNPLFNNDDLDSSNDESLSEEDVPAEEFKVYSNPLFNEDEINYDKLDPHCFNVESDFVESLLNCDTFIDSSSKFNFSEEHNADEERIKREHADYISRMEMLFTINPRPRPTMNANTNFESIPSLPIPVQDNDSQREEIDIISSTDDVLPPGVENDDDSDREVDAVEELRVDNSISNTKHEYFESEESEFDNPSVPLLPSKPPDEELDFEIDFGDEISVVRNTIVKFECIDARVKFDVSNDENDDLSYFMFVISAKVFSFLFAESEDTIFDPGFAPHRLKFSCVGYLSQFTRSSHPFLDISLGKSISYDQYCLAVICRLYA
nr:hypothetical protein [Tanacetum cinerariifolium]